MDGVTTDLEGVQLQRPGTRRWLSGLRGAWLGVILAALVALPVSILLSFGHGLSLAIYRNVLIVGLCYTTGYLAVFEWLLPSVEGSTSARWRNLLTSVSSLAAAIALGGGLKLLVSGWMGFSSDRHWWVGGSILVLVRLFHLDYERLERRTREVELREAGLRHQAARAELTALQARVDPHFLFNSLNTVASLIEEEPKRAVDVVTRLARLYRHTLEASRTDTTNLAAELDACRTYLEIQALRFDDRLTFAITVAPDVDPSAIGVPPRCLQPLVENAVLHGGSAPGAWRIELDVRRTDGDIVMTLDDDGPGPGRSHHRGQGTGLVDLTDRLALIDRAIRLETQARPQGGFRARLTLPATPGAPS